jgi:magnesium transporter
MLYLIQSGKIQTVQLEEINLNERSQYFGILETTQSDAVLQKLGFGKKPLTDALASRSTAFENHDGFDFICLNIRDRKSLHPPFERAYIYLHKNIILFIAEKIQPVEKIIRQITEDEKFGIGFDRLLSNFFERLIVQDANLLEDIEQEISDLENALITSKKRDCVREIISLRKKLMAFKRYYEQLLNVLDELLENENNTLHGNSLRYFKIFAGKVDRRYHSILNLRDYVTQVREAYQAEVDIGLNNIMKIFTVITAVFLPLTLIVGWYGMNLQMPEYRWAEGYPMVILLSLAVVTFCLFYFKKHKWF